MYYRFRFPALALLQLRGGRLHRAGGALLTYLMAAWKYAQLLEGNPMQLFLLRFAPLTVDIDWILADAPACLMAQSSPAAFSMTGLGANVGDSK